MINLTGLVGKITGKGATGATQASDGARTAGEPGIAIGGEFAALVELAQAGAQPGQGKLRLVVDNAALPAGTSATSATDNAVPADLGRSVTTLMMAEGMIDPSLSDAAMVQPTNGETAPTGANAPATRPGPAMPQSARPPFSIASATPNAFPNAFKVQLAADATPADVTIVATQGQGDPAIDATGEEGQDDKGPPETNGETAPTGANAPATRPGPAMPQSARPPFSIASATPNAFPNAFKVQLAADATPADVTIVATQGQGDPAIGATGEEGFVQDDKGPPETEADGLATQQQPAVPIDPQGIMPAALQVGQVVVGQVSTMRQPVPKSEKTPLAQAITGPTLSGRQAAASDQPTAAEAIAAVTTPQPNPPKTASTAQSFAPIAALIAGAPDVKPKGDVKIGRIAAPVVPTDTGSSVDAATADLTGASSATFSDTPRSRSAEPTSLATAAIGVSAPLRAIVDGLPPVIQSELASAPVSVVTGPSTSQKLGDQVIDMGVSGQWIDRMAREITQLADGSGHSRFTLNPPHLGRLQIDLWQDQGATSVRLVAETDEATRRLAEGRTALQADARVAALHLGTITVEKSASAHESARDQNGNGQRQGNDQTGQAQQQSSGQGGQGQGQGQGQARAGNGQQRDDWVSRLVPDETNQQSDASTRAAARRAAAGNVRFA